MGEETQLERATAAYYESLADELLRDEQELERIMDGTSRPNPDTEE